MLDLVEAIEAAGIPIHHLDFGGGLGIDYNGDTSPKGLFNSENVAKLDARGFGAATAMIEQGARWLAMRACASPKRFTSNPANKKTSASAIRNEPKR